GPAFFRLYLTEQRKGAGRSILPDARAFMGGGSPKTPTMHDELKSEIGAGLYPQYGMSECPMVSTAFPDTSEVQRSLTDGYPVPGLDVQVVGPDGDPISVGDEGEIVVKGLQLFLGYVGEEFDRGSFD